MFSKGKSEKAKPGAKAGARSGAKAGTRSVPSLIGADLRIAGDLVSDGDTQIDGSIEGDIRCRQLTIGETAMVKGEILADSVTIAGRVTGQIRARAVKLTRTAQVRGDVYHESLAIEPGAHIEGRCERVESGQSPSETTFAVAASDEAPATRGLGAKPATSA